MLSNSEVTSAAPGAQWASAEIPATNPNYIHWRKSHWSNDPKGMTWISSSLATHYYIQPYPPFLNVHLKLRWIAYVTIISAEWLRNSYHCSEWIGNLHIQPCLCIKMSSIWYQLTLFPEKLTFRWNTRLAKCTDLSFCTKTEWWEILSPMSANSCICDRVSTNKNSIKEERREHKARHNSCTKIRFFYNHQQEQFRAIFQPLAWT